MREEQRYWEALSGPGCVQRVNELRHLGDQRIALKLVEAVTGRLIAMFIQVWESDLATLPRNRREPITVDGQPVTDELPF